MRHYNSSGRFWIYEYGSADASADQFNTLYAYSPLHNVKEGAVYPPTLVLTGESDPIVPVTNGRILAGRIPDARLEVVPGGHLFLLTHAEAMAALINEFLDAPDR